MTKKITPTQIKEILRDYSTCCVSREVSLQMRKEVLTGKAKFAVSDDGKELLQVAMAKVFKKGDFRADYYRGFTLMFALGLAQPKDIYAQLYGDCDNDPFAGGRQMTGHHCTPSISKEGQWLPLKDRYNISIDTSTTAGQMARGFGLAAASKAFRENDLLKDSPLSNNGNEVCFCNIGDGSTSEGVFWEAVNAAGVVQIPLVLSVWDDGYAISVPKEKQTVKASISKALAGMKKNKNSNGIEIFTVKGWDYLALCETFEKATKISREKHIPTLIHIEEVTQPQGHSTSGSHERYKNAKRLAWEEQYDGNHQFRNWILQEGIATEDQLITIEKNAKKEALEGKKEAWHNYYFSVQEVYEELKEIYQVIAQKSNDNTRIKEITSHLHHLVLPVRAEIIRNARRMVIALRKCTACTEERKRLQTFIDKIGVRMTRRYSTFLYSESERSALKIPIVEAQYTENSKKINGYEVLNAFFDQSFSKYPNLYAFGEDVGKIGGVNQAFSGLQEKYGEHRIFDTGIREWTIVGQAIGMAARGLRPIAEIQYLDYLLYAISPLSDDLATLRYRSNNQQMAPAIIRTRGHRLEGIWHSGSPMSLLLGSLRGIYILTPRNMVQAAGMYNTMLQSDDPALIIECLNGYRIKEKMPENLDTFTVPLGIPEVLIEGTDLTLVTYGSSVRIAKSALKMLKAEEISVELIDVQTLLPFDLNHKIVESLKKTNRIIFFDEDVPGGASAYMMREVLEVQGGYRYLDSPPVTITSKAHRPAYSTDGDYYSKPSAEDVYETIFDLMMESEPGRFE